MLHADVLVVYDSRQARRAPPLDCAQCETFDSATSSLPGRSYEAVVLDGHSLPPENVVGAPISRIEAILEQAAPRLLVANTCYGAEIRLLRGFFTASPRAEVAMASAEPLPWPGSDIDGACLARHGAIPACFHVPSSIRNFSREDVARLEERALETLATISACRDSPPLVRLRPLYLCIEDQAGPTAVMEVSFDDLQRDCGTESSAPLRVVRCGLRSDPPAGDASPAR
ncbi:MAG: hypothetical protein QM820_29640 [Minicystis sp.]